MDNLERAKKAFIEADRAGNTEDAKFFLDYIRKNQPSAQMAPEAKPEAPKSAPGGTLAALGHGLNEGLTFGFSDEIAAYPQSLVEGRKYADVLAERDAASRALTAANPKTSLLANVVGGMATGGAGAARALGSQAIRAAAPLVRGAASVGVGAGTGAVAGAGYAPPGQRAEGALVGGAIGGVIGGAVPAAGRLIGAGVDKVRTAVSPRAAEKVGADTIAKYAARDAIDPLSLSQRVKAMGDEAMPVDLGRNLEALGEHVANRPGAGMANAVEKLTERNMGQGPRVMAAVRKAAGITDDVADIPRDPRIRQQFAESLDDVVEIVPEDATFLKLADRPSFKRAWAKAGSLAREEGETLPRLDEFVAGIRDGNSQALPTRQLHYLKKAMDDVLEPKRDPVTGRLVTNLGKNELRAQQATRAEFRDLLKSKSPRYAEALDSTSGELRNLESYRLGGDALRKPVKDVATQVVRLSGKDLDAYRHGFVEALEASTSKSADLGYDITSKVIDSKRLNAIFGDKADDLMKALRQERDMRQTAGRIAGNSRTAYRTELAKDMETGDTGILGELAGNPTPSGLFSAAVRRTAQALTGERRPPEKAMEAASRILFNSDPAEIERLILQSRNITGAVGGRPSDIPNWIVGVGAGPLNPGVQVQQRRKR